MTFRRSRIGENARPEDRNNIGAGQMAAPRCLNDRRPQDLAELVDSGSRRPGDQTVIVVSFRLIT